MIYLFVWLKYFEIILFITQSIVYIYAFLVPASIRVCGRDNIEFGPIIVGDT